MSIFGDTITALTKTRSERVPTSGSAALSQLTGVSGASPVQHMEAYGTVGWLFATVERIAQSVAAVEWNLYRRRPNGDRTEITNHPLLSLWNDVSPYYTSEDFRETGQQHQELSGETWWILIGGTVPRELQVVRPDRMRPMPDPETFISHYEYVIGSNKIRLEVEDVIFIRRPSPLNPHRGIGPVQSLMYDLGSEKLAAQWTQTFFRNSAEPGGVIEVPSTLTNVEFDEMKTRWGEQHRGVANAHRVAIIENGKWVERKYTQRDMQFEQLRKLNRDIIVGAFGMPQAMLGVSENVNRANAEAAEVMFGRWVIRPRVRRIRGAINARLAPLFGSDLFFDFVDPTPADQELNLRQASEGFAGGFLTLNEARELMGLGEVPDGDEFFTPPSSGFMLGPAGEIMVRGVQDDVRSSQIVRRNGHASEGVPHDVPRDDLAASVEGWFRDVPDDLGRKISVSEKVERTMLKKWAKRLRDERDDLIAFLGDEETRLAAPGDGPYERTERSTLLKLEQSDLEGYDWDWWTKYGEDVVEELTEAAELAITDTFPEMGSEATRVAAEYARARGASLLQLTGDLNLVDLTRRRVNELVAETIEQGESLGTLTRNLREDFAFSRERASAVARTETATAQGQGAQRAAMSQGLDEKSWLTQGDSLVEAECEMNEKVGWIKLSAIFPSGKETIPEHPNCRCTVLYRGEPVSDIDPGEDLLEIDMARTLDGLGGPSFTDGVCPRCDKLVQRNVPRNLLILCTRCKTHFNMQGTRGTTFPNLTKS